MAPFLQGSGLFFKRKKGVPLCRGRGTPSFDRVQPQERAPQAAQPQPELPQEQPQEEPLWNQMRIRAITITQTISLSNRLQRQFIFHPPSRNREAGDPAPLLYHSMRKDGRCDCLVFILPCPKEAQRQGRFFAWGRCRSCPFRRSGRCCRNTAPCALRDQCPAAPTRSRSDSPRSLAARR